MRVKGITAAAIAALALAGCAQPSEERLAAEETFSDLLMVQSAMIREQESLTDRIGGAWKEKPLRAYIEDSLMPSVEQTEDLSAPPGDPAAGAVNALATASAALGSAGERVEEMLDELKVLNRFSETNPNYTGYATTPLSAIEKAADSIEPASLELERELLASLASSESSLEAIRSGLDELGTLDDSESGQIDDGLAQIETLKGETGPASAEFKIGLEGALRDGIGAIERARAPQLPDDACAQQPVGYPSTLGKPSVYVYVFNGVTCEFGKQLALSLFSDSTFRETGSGYSIPPETGPLPEWAEQSFMCELGQVSPIGDPRMVLCFPEGKTEDWEAPRVAFQAPSTAG